MFDLQTSTGTRFGLLVDACCSRLHSCTILHNHVFVNGCGIHLDVDVSFWHTYFCGMMKSELKSEIMLHVSAHDDTPSSENKMH